MNWELEIALYWPHDRFVLGWDIINPTEEFDYTTIKLYLTIITITLNF